MVHSQMFRYVIRRLLFMIPTFLGISILVFALLHASGDPLSLIRLASPTVDAETLENIRAYYGLDKPVPEQYLVWLTNFLRFDLGESYRFHTKVNFMIGAWAFETIKLQLVALAIAIGVAIPLGIRSAIKQYSKGDMTVTAFSLFGISMPPFWFGVILIIIFSFYLNVLPPGGAYGGSNLWPVFGIKNFFLDAIVHLIMPSIVVAYVWLALYFRLLRANLLNIIKDDYILAARASGIKERVIHYKYALKMAFRPLLTFTGVRLGLVIAGVPMTETVFNWPGLGLLFVDSALSLDFPVVMGIIMVVTIFMMVSNLIVDLLYAVIDPRVRLA